MKSQISLHEMKEHLKLAERIAAKKYKRISVKHDGIQAYEYRNLLKYYTAAVKWLDDELNK